MAVMAWSKFFWRDWMSELSLRGCSLAARGLWMDMLCIAAQHEPPGYVAVNGNPLDGDGLAKVIGADKAEVNPLLNELHKAGVYSRDEKTGMIYSRRMVADHAKYVKAVSNGKKGGNPTLGKYGGKERSVNHLDKGHVIPPFMPPDNHEDNGQVNPQLNGDVKHRSQKPEAISQKESKNQNPSTHSQPVLRASHKPRAEAVSEKGNPWDSKPWMDVRMQIVTSLRNANMLFDPDMPPDPSAVIRAWCEDGLDPSLCLTLVQSVVTNAHSNGQKIGLPYIAKAVSSSHAKRMQGAGGATLAPIAPARPRLVAREDAVCEGDKPLPDVTSHNMIDLWERGGPWAPPLGMRPDQHGCRVPMDILQARGYRDEHGRMSERYLEIRATARANRAVTKNSLEPIPKSNNGAAHP